MTRKCFACILTAKDAMKRIQALAANPSNASQIMGIAAKFNADFGDVDPSWEPGDPVKPRAAVAASQPAVKPVVPAMARAVSADPRVAAPLF